MTTRGQPWVSRTARRRIRRRRRLAHGVVVLALVGAAGAVTVAATGVLDAEPDVARPVAAEPAPTTTSTQGTTATPTPDVATPESPRAVPGPSPELGVGTTRTPTAADPLRVWIAGDSMWEVAGPILADRLEATGVVAATVEVRYSTGLTRPDVFDWPAHASEVLAEADPELVLFLVGANDAQALADGGVVHRPVSASFAEVYAGRVRDLMERLTAGERLVVWVGLPVMRPSGYDADMAAITEIQSRVAATVPGVMFVPTRALFADADGAYAPVLPDAAGQPQSLRGGDGIHLSHAGGERLAEVLLTRVRQVHPLG